MNLYFPLTIGSTKQVIRLCKNANLMRVDFEDCSEIVGKDQLKFDEDGFLVGYRNLTSLHAGMLPGRINLSSFEFGVRFQCANFLLVTSEREYAEMLQFTMQLLGPCIGGPILGYADPRVKSQYVYLRHTHYWPLGGGTFLKCDSEGERRLIDLFGNVERMWKQAKLRTMAEWFTYAEADHVPTLDGRFLALAIVCEMLLLPEQTQELSYRFKLRFAKIFAQIENADVTESYARAGVFYKTRSAIAHKGTANVRTPLLNELRTSARTLLLTYIQDPSKFDEATLDAMCL